MFSSTIITVCIITFLLLYRNTNKRLDYPIYTRFEVIQPGQDGHPNSKQKQMEHNVPPSNINSCNADIVSIISEDLASCISLAYSMSDAKIDYDKSGTMLSTSKPTAVPITELPNDLCSSELLPSNNSRALRHVISDGSEVVNSTPDLVTQPTLSPGHAIPSDIPVTS